MNVKKKDSHFASSGNLKEVRVPVSGGVLLAAAGTDPNYPGLSVCLELKDGQLIDLCYCEGKPDGESGDISLYTYEDVKTEDYTHKHVFRAKEIRDALHVDEA
jgi:hypothetical protein